MLKNHYQNSAIVKIQILLCIALLLLFAVSSCTHSRNSDSTNTTDTGVASPTPIASPIKNVIRGGTLRISTDGSGGSSDPHNSISRGVLSLGSGLAYSRIFQLKYGADIPSNNRIPECDLCQSWRKRNNTTFEITLNQNAKWQNVTPLNGRPVTADDVVWSLKRQLDPQNKSSQLLHNIETVEAIDQQTIRIELKLPDAELFEKLAHSASSIIPKEQDTLTQEFEEGTVAGSGAWLVNESQNDITIATVNPLYYKEGTPYLDELFIHFNKDPFTRISGMLIGITDVAVTEGEYVSQLQADYPDLNVSSLPTVYPDQGVEFAINTQHPLLNSLQVRKAIFLSINVKSIATNIAGRYTASLYDVPFASVNISPPDSSWINPQAIDGVFNNREEALDTLQNTEYTPYTDTLTLRVGEYGETYINYANAIAESISDIGIPVKVERVTTRVFATDVWAQGDYDMFIGASPPIDSLSSRLFSVYHSKGQANTTNYHNSELDKLIEKQSREYDFVKRADMFKEIEELIVAGRHRLNLSATDRHWVWKECVQDFNPNDTFGNSAFLTTVWIDGC